MVKPDPGITEHLVKLPPLSHNSFLLLNKITKAVKEDDQYIGDF